MSESRAFHEYCVAMVCDADKHTSSRAVTCAANAVSVHALVTAHEYFTQPKPRRERSSEAATL